MTSELTSDISRRRFLQRTGLGVGAAGLGSLVCAGGLSGCGVSTELHAANTAAEAPVPNSRPDAPRPNIVVIVSDDHRHDIMGVAGDPYIQTPHMDRMAAEGVFFEQAFCAAGVCSPSRASILTGQYPFQCGAAHMAWMNRTFHAQATPFPARLQAAGYHTAHIGKWHLGEGHLPKPGYDYWVGFHWVGDFFDQELHFNGEPQTTSGFTDDTLADLAAEYIQNRAQTTKPFCLYLALKAPHLPFGYPERHEHAFDDVTIPKPDSFDEDYDASGRNPAIRDSMININSFGGGLQGFDNDWDRYIKSYYRSTMAIDDAVGRVMEALEAAGVSENTLLLYTSDQGYNLGEHQLCEKHYAYEETWRVPMLLRYPTQAPPGLKVEQLAMTIDIAPTILDYCGVAIPEGTTGASWRPLLEGEAETWREDILFDHPTEHDRNVVSQLAVRTANYKLITYPRQDFIELYDLADDPREMRNVAHEADYAVALADMESRLERLCEENGWAHYVPHYFSLVHAIGPIPEADCPAVERALYFMPEELAQPMHAGGKRFEWQRLDAAPNHNFHIQQAFGDAPGTYCYLVADIALQAPQDPYTILRYVPFRPIRAFHEGRIILECAEPGWEATLNPILKPGNNRVVLRFACAGNPNVQLHSYAPAGSVVVT